MNSSNPVGIYSWVKAFFAYKEGQEIIQDEKNSFMKNTAIAAAFAVVIFLTFKI